MASKMAAVNEKGPPSYSAYALYKLGDLTDKYYMVVYIFQVCFQSVNNCDKHEQTKEKYTPQNN